MTWWADSFFMTSVSTRLKPRSSGWQRMTVPRRGFIRSQRGVIFNTPWRQTCHQLSTDSGKGKWFGQINHLTHWWRVSAPACLKGPTDRRAPTAWLKARVVSLTFHLRDDRRWVTNTSLCGSRRGYWHSDSPGALRNRCHSWQGALTATAGTVGPLGFAERHVLPVLTVTRLTTSSVFLDRRCWALPPFCFAITVKAHLFAGAPFPESSPWPVFHLGNVSNCVNSEVWGACPLYPAHRREWRHIPPTAGLRNPSTSSAVDTLMSSLLAAM